MRCFIAAVFIGTPALSAVDIFAQPDDGIAWLHLPTAEEIATSEEVEFVIFAREPIGEDPWEFVASVWEVRTSGDGQITPRVRFERSRWAPELLVGQPSCERRDLVRLQVPDPSRAPDYRVSLYSIDYRDWSVTTVWRGEQAMPVLWHGDEVYVSIQDGRRDDTRLMVIRGNQLVEVVEQFELILTLEPTGKLYLVRREVPGVAPYAIFNAQSQEFTPIGGLPDGVIDGLTSAVITPDLAYLAIHTSRDIDQSTFDQTAIFQPQLLTSQIRVVQIAEGRTWERPIDLLVSPGSGEPLCFRDPLIRFDDEGGLLYHASDTEVRRFDPTAGNADRVVDPGLQDDVRWTTARPDREIPDRLRPFLSTGYLDDHDIAHAYLKLHGVAYKRSTVWADSVTAFSPDGSRFLLKMFHSGRDSVFFLGDLSADTLVEIPCPVELLNANAMTIEAVRWDD